MHNKECATVYHELSELSSYRNWNYDSSEEGRILLARDGAMHEEYQFGENDILKSYRFYSSDSTYTYAEYYDRDGFFVESEGAPIVYSEIEAISQDIVQFQFYVFSFKKHSKSFQIKVNNDFWRDGKSAIHQNLPGIRLYTFQINAQKIDSLVIKQKFIYKQCNSLKTIYDSLKINRR